MKTFLNLETNLNDIVVHSFCEIKSDAEKGFSKL
jgi:hypothetical protein